MNNTMLLRYDNGKLRATDGHRFYFPDRSITDLKEGFITNVVVTLDKGTYAFIKFDYVTYTGITDDNIENAYQLGYYITNNYGVLNSVPFFVDTYHTYGLVIGNCNKIEVVFEKFNFMYRERSFYKTNLYKEINYINKFLSPDNTNGKQLWEDIKKRRLVLQLKNAEIININDNATDFAIAKLIRNWDKLELSLINKKIVRIDSTYRSDTYVMQNGKLISYEGEVNEPIITEDITESIKGFMETNKIATITYKRDLSGSNETTWNETLAAYNSGMMICNNLKGFGNCFKVWTLSLQGIENWDDISQVVKDFVNKSVEEHELRVKSIAKKVGIRSLPDLNSINWKKQLIYTAF